MSEITPQKQGAPALYTNAQYLRLYEQGLLAEDDRVELLEGVIVAMPPRTPRHDSGITRVQQALARVVGDRAVVRVQCTFVAGERSLPEPDVAVVPGRVEDYDLRHPREALLLVEVAEASVRTDRLSKSRIYATAGVPEYWILDLEQDRLEVHRGPDRSAGRYRSVERWRPGDRVAPDAFPDAVLAVKDLLPASG